MPGKKNKNKTLYNLITPYLIGIEKIIWRSFLRDLCKWHLACLIYSNECKSQQVYFLFYSDKRMHYCDVFYSDKMMYYCDVFYIDKTMYHCDVSIQLLMHSLNN